MRGASRTGQGRRDGQGCSFAGRERRVAACRGCQLPALPPAAAPQHKQAPAPTHLMQASRPGLAPAQQRAHWSPQSLQTRKKGGGAARLAKRAKQRAAKDAPALQLHVRSASRWPAASCTGAGRLAGPPGCVVCSTKHRSGDSWRCTTTAMQADSWGTPAGRQRDGQKAGGQTGRQAGAVQQSALAQPQQEQLRHQHFWLPFTPVRSTPTRLPAYACLAVLRNDSPRSHHARARAHAPAARRLSTARRLKREAHTPAMAPCSAAASLESMLGMESYSPAPAVPSQQYHHSICRAHSRLAAEPRAAPIH